MKILIPGVSMELARHEFGGGGRTLDEIEPTEIVGDQDALTHTG